MACGILVPRTGIEPAPPAVEARSLNHWTAREVPGVPLFRLCFLEAGRTYGFRNLGLCLMATLGCVTQTGDSGLRVQDL